jgi:hypothetical protein
MLVRLKPSERGPELNTIDACVKSSLRTNATELLLKDGVISEGI